MYHKMPCISHISHILRPGLASDFRRTRGSRLERQKTGGAWRGIGLGSLQRNATIRGAQEGKTWKIMENRLNLCESLECMRSVISKD